EPVDVGLACAEVAALHRVVEQPVNTVAVVLVVLRGVDAALGRDAVGAARAVLEAEALNVVAELRERGSRGATGQARAHDDERVLTLVGGIDELELELVPLPLRLDGPAGDVR